MTDFDKSLLLEAFKKPPTLSSIFPRISLETEKLDSSAKSLPACQLDVGNIVKGGQSPSEDALNLEMGRLENLHPEARSATFAFILQKYGWRVANPSHDEDKMQDVALCDSVRVRKALENAGENGDYLLVKGDLSGIQTYIYGGIQPKDAGGQAKLSKRLRGRSILVSLLTDFLADAILHELGLSHWHLLFAGGGHFNLLLPYSKKLEVEVDVLSEKIGSEMRRAFGDTLDLVVVSVHCDNSISKNAGPFFEKLNAKREAKKYRQHSKSLHDHFYPNTKLTTKEKNDLKEARDKLTEDLGTRLPNRNLLLETIASDEILPAKNQAFEVLHFNLHKAHHQLFIADGYDSKSLKTEWDKAEDLLFTNDKTLKSARVFTMNSTEIFPADTKWGSKLKMPVSFGFRFLGKYAPPHPTENRPKTFEELAYPDPNPEKPLNDEQLKKSGLLMLSSMRLDVDDLGCIFSHGLGKNASLGQVIALSREMHYFFTAHFDQLAAKPEHDIYVIYSGGDDAFVVGRWDKIIAFSRQLQKDFNQFVQKNDEVHFSAGIFMGDPKYPVERFYRDAGRLEKEAKEFKDRMNVFQRVIEWPVFDSKIKFGEGLFKILSEKQDTKAKHKLTSAFMYRILQLVKTSFHERNTIDENGYKVKRGYVDVARFGRNIANMRYLFARHGFTEDEITKIDDEIRSHLTTDFLSSFSFGSNSEDSKKKSERLRDYLVAFNFALYSLRFHKKLEQ